MSDHIQGFLRARLHGTDDSQTFPMTVSTTDGDCRLPNMANMSPSGVLRARFASVCAEKGSSADGGMFEVSCELGEDSARRNAAGQIERRRGDGRRKAMLSQVYGPRPKAHRKGSVAASVGSRSQPDPGVRLFWTRAAQHPDDLELTAGARGERLAEKNLE